jgi:hypothetical protein
MLALPHLAGWPLPVLSNEAEPSSRDATARAFALPSFGVTDRSSTLWAQLHDSRPFVMANTLQLTRTTKLCLALSRWTQMDTDYNPKSEARNLRSSASICGFPASRRSVGQHLASRLHFFLHSSFPAVTPKPWRRRIPGTSPVTRHLVHILDREKTPLFGQETVKF